MDVDGPPPIPPTTTGAPNEVPAGDLESELREFLESAGPSLSPHAHLHDADNTIADILME